jgi:23S rRNA (uracil1939-C5)-methyltransferase
MTRRKQRLALTIDSLAAGGDGVGRDDEGRVTFVPQSVPGERVLVELLEARKQFARGRVVDVLQPSEGRVEPACVLFAEGQCGGCQWQHVAPSVQRSAKESIVDNALRRSIERGLHCEPLLEPCAPLGWRRRARLSFWVGGPIVLGFFPAKSQKITDVVTCPQLEAGLQRGLDLVREHLLPALRHRGEVELLLAADGRVHVTVHGTAADQGLRAFAERDGIAGLVHGKRVYGDAQVLLEGEVPASSAGFAQASKAGNLALCEVVRGALGELAGKRVLELYAGSGNFTRLLSDASEVLAVEQEATLTGQVAFPGLQWRPAEVVETCAALVSESARFDVVLLDPPRSGAKEAIADIAALAPERIVYVSCDAATLSRDVELLHALGYRAQSAQPIDLMPQTSQVEVVLVLIR